MTSFRIGHATADHWTLAASSCLAQLGELPARMNLGFLYVSDVWVNELAEVLAYFRAYTEVEHWVGTVGVAVCAMDREYSETPAIAVLVGAFPQEAYRVFCNVREDLAELAVHEPWRARTEARFAVVHADPMNGMTPQLVARLAAHLGDGFLVGGITSSRHSHIQVADGLTHGGLSGVMFSGSVPVATGLSQGCSPIGPVHELTRCQRNIAVELDGRPALEVFYEDIGEILARDLNKVAGYIFAGLPIKGSDTGDYLVRNLVGVDSKRQWLAVGELLEPGDGMLFCRRDAQSAQQDLVRMLQQLKQRVRELPTAGLYFSCLGRGGSLFGQNRELEIIREVLGDFPLVGFFANGEISHDRVYGYTGVLSLFL
jgi:small ligand-binding sensory domain FIST